MKHWKRLFVATLVLLVCGSCWIYSCFHNSYSRDSHLKQLRQNLIAVTENQILPSEYKQTEEAKADNQMHLSLLSENELEAFRKCESQVQKKTKINPTLINPSCSFMNGTGRKAIALVSETGSGNTWVRGLLEKVTGVCTGAIYCDAALRNSGMVGEFVIGPSVSVVKTHTPDYQWEGVAHPHREADPNHKDGYYGSAVLLVRNPFDAFVSEWNRFVTIQKLETQNSTNLSGKYLTDDSHTYTLGKEMFGSNNAWNQFLRSICNRWYNVYTRWFASAIVNNKPILVLHYEDIKQNKVYQVERLLNFLDFNFSHGTVMRQLNKGFQIFRRNQTEHFDHYTISQRKRVNGTINKAIRFLRQYDRTNTFKLERYLQS